VYPVPDEHVGDQVMAAIVLVDDAELGPADLVAFLTEQPDLSPKAWPRYVWVADELPATATNKVLKRELIARGTHPGTGVVWTRAARAKSYTTGPAE
jgi:fatty-acyl-CoA synthase